MPGRARSASVEAYRELIIEGLRRGRNAMAIWQDLVDDYGFTAPLPSATNIPLLYVCSACAYTLKIPPTDSHSTSSAGNE